MINRIYIKNLLSFKEILLNFDKGLIVITGPSGAGKSIFINAILANFALVNQEAKLCELELIKPKELNSQIFELEDEIVIKSIKKDRVRFFINEQNISKKALKELFKDYILYISVRDKSGFESSSLLKLIDNFIDSKEFIEQKNRYNKLFNHYKKLENELKKKQENIKNAKDKAEFLEFEIDKIEKIDPKENEYEELLKLKKKLSKIDKINQIANEIDEIFKYEDRIYELFEMLEKDSSYFNETMNNLRNDLEDIKSLSEELNDINIEELLDRLSNLDALNKRFGSIKEALNYLEKIKKELNALQTIKEDLTKLEKEHKTLYNTLLNLATNISLYRKKAAKKVEKELEKLLKELKLPAVEFKFLKKELYENGIDEITISMGKTTIENLSGGEFNRVRLALLSVLAINNSNGVIILDEIDANVSGDESIAIANMISNLSKSFQIFAISHQPHLSSKANNHILITKKDNISQAKILNKKERINEIARIIGGENFNKESLEFAKKLIEN